MSEKEVSAPLSNPGAGEVVVEPGKEDMNSSGLRLPETQVPPVSSQQGRGYDTGGALTLNIPLYSHLITATRLMTLFRTVLLEPLLSRLLLNQGPLFSTQ